MMRALVVLAVLLVLTAVVTLQRRRRLALLTAAGAHRLPPCTCTLRGTLSWLRLPRADTYLLDGVLVVLTINGAVRLFSRRTHAEPIPGWWFRFADVVVDEVALVNDVVTVRYSGFTRGTLTMSGLPREELQRVVRALEPGARVSA